MLKKVLFSGAALVGALALTATAQASVIASGSTTATSPGGATPVITFTANPGQGVDVTITDCCIGGDYYATYVDGGYVGTTPFTPEFGSQLSSATFTAILGGGTSHTLQMFDQTDFFLPAGLSYTISTPEPEAWALMLVGVFGLGGALRARRRTEAQMA